MHLHIHTQKMPFFGGGRGIKSYLPTHKRPLSFQDGAQDWLSQEELFDIIVSLLRPSSCLPLHSLLVSQKLADVSSNDSSDSLETRFLSILCTRSYPHLRKGRTTFLHCCWTLSCSTSALGGTGGTCGQQQTEVTSRLRLSPVSPVGVGMRWWEDMAWPCIWGGWLRSLKSDLVPSSLKSLHG